MKKGLVSIVIPSYNSSDFLPRCVESIDCQTYKNIEVILVDDGSNQLEYDKTVAIAEKYPYIKLLRQKNQGQGVARNYGLENTNGEWILFLDSDDSIDSSFIDELITASDDSIDVVCCNYTINLRGKKILMELHKKNASPIENVNDILELYLKRGIAPAPWCKLIRKSAVSNISFPSFRAREDEYFNLLLFSRVRKIAFTNAFGYNRYVRDGSTERSKMSYKKMASIASCELAEKVIMPHFKSLSNEIMGYCLRNYYFLIKEHFFEKSELSKKTVNFLFCGFDKYVRYVDYVNQDEQCEIRKFIKHRKLTILKFRLLKLLKTIKRLIIK